TYPDGTVSTNITVNESHVSNLTSINGCDSVVTTNVNVINAFNITENIDLCSGLDHTYPDGTVSTNITANESHTSNFVTSMGCDSIVTTNINVLPVYNLTENITACENSSVTYPDGFSETITANTSHTSNLMTLAGCDSVIVTNVLMAPVYNLSENITACENSSVTYPDGFSETITANTSHTSNLTTTAGCDSVIVTNVNMNPVYTLSENVDVCTGSDHTYPDGTVSTNITVNESHVSVFTSVNGCDSTITTNINITPTNFVNAGNDQSICEGESVTLAASGSDNYTWDNGVNDGVSFVPGTTDHYVVTATDLNGCPSADSLEITVNPLPAVAFEGDRLSGCTPFQVNFDNLNSPIGDNCFWDFGDGNTAVGCGSVSHIYETPGIYSVSLTVTANGCTGTETYTDYIEVYSPPLAAFEMDHDIINEDDNQVEFTNNSYNADFYTWDFGDGTINTVDEHPVHGFGPTQNSGYTITLFAENAVGCVDSTQLFIPFEDVLIFYVPNVFTPDGDDVNNTFYPVFTSGYDPYDYHLMIFNRWGELIFESYNALVGWNGHYGEQGLVQDGVYIWSINFKESKTDKRYEVRGHVSVLK
ncbi:MAG: PKD domain-containing protein, partial [Crocinitomicaceae bacterium]